MPRVPEALDRIDRWLGENAPENVQVLLTPAPIAELELLGAHGRGASELAALHARFGGACGTLEIFGAALMAPSRAEGLTEILTRLGADPSFGRWDPAWFPFLSWEAETYAIDFREGAGMRVVHWERDTRALTVQAPSLAAWIGLLAAAADAGVLEWQNGIARDLVLYRELQATLMPGYPRALET